MDPDEFDKTEYNKKYYEEHKEKIRKQQKEKFANITDEEREKRNARERERARKNPRHQVLTEEQKAHKAEVTRLRYLANKDAVSEKNRQRYLENKDEILARNTAYRLANPAKAKACKDKWYSDPVNKARTAATNKAYRKAHSKELKAAEAIKHRKRKYGLTDEQYKAMLVLQNHQCAACEIPFGVTGVDEPCVDHNHTTNQVRGILCGLCNTSAGMAKDCPIRLRKIADYLERTDDLFKKKKTA